MKNNINRRNFFKLSAIGSATVAATGCSPDPVEELIPLLVPPYEYVPGESIHYATTCQECTAACGLVIRTREGRAIKAEGNPENPLNRGRLCAQGQAILQGLYSPSRAKAPTSGKDAARRAVIWADGQKILVDKLVAARDKGGKNILYIGLPRSGTFQTLLQQWLQLFGDGTAIQYDLNPVNSLKTANQLSFGRKEIPHFAMDQAEVLLSFGADFMESWLNPMQLTRSYTQMHSGMKKSKGKFIYVSPYMSLTGSNADEWVSCPSGQEYVIALALSRMLLAEAAHLNPQEKTQLQIYLEGFSIEKTAEMTGISAVQLQALAEAFKRAGKSLAIAGGNSSAGKDATRLQIAVNILNYVAGNIGKTVLFGADYQLGGDSLEQIESAVKAMNEGRYEVVIIENVNPIFTLPAESGFNQALSKVPWVVSFSTENDETSALADQHLPVSHFLESWGDAAPRSGLVSLQQPTMSVVPAFDTLEIGDLLLQTARLTGETPFAAVSYQQYLQESWRSKHSQSASQLDFKQFWKQSLQRGGVYGDFQPAQVTLQGGVYSVKPEISKHADNSLTLLAVNSSLHNANSRGGNKTWLLEIPHPITQVVWDSWIEIHPETAIKLGIRHGELVKVSTQNDSVELAAWLFYGLDRDTVAIPAGLGRKVAFPGYRSSRGRAKFLPVLESAADLKIQYKTVGYNVMNLLSWARDQQSGDFAFAGEKVTLQRTGRKSDLVTLDGQYRQDIKSRKTEDKSGFGDRSQKERGFVQIVSTDGAPSPFEAEHHQLRKRHYTLNRKDKSSFYDPLDENVRQHVQMAGKETPGYHDPYKWEMIIDLDRCTGCSACVVACYAENNIPLVGKNGIAVGREMSWLRIERYIEYNSQTQKPEIYYTPEMCQQCDNAGCEPVCPVYATYQTPDGLNAMIYNRCVGTRYCSNNCAYKQRRFNYRTYQFPSPLHMQLNPAVSVRDKGVMEKCTFCQHRIREMKDIAKDQGRNIYDGEIQTACQQSCPADAITFGNIKDKNSRVRQHKSTTKRGYTQLPEINFQPAITYLKKVNHNNRKA
ncbi:MAG: 4Fe-4S dicluster domain-containing protein [Deltaproteobacteria bacterium]|nr:4Fe-4S dicluster domain-containing protein [Deltaproteobacteria bacterium]MBT4641530.1 4Fe-4S dicluster domain-containing protein [Deltaproteobacteria bacterium]MBT6616216.1 4Fe-4S dicluster domain-containing protein [Deltaproteobacteria bacterium]